MCFFLLSLCTGSGDKVGLELKGCSNPEGLLLDFLFQLVGNLGLTSSFLWLPMVLFVICVWGGRLEGEWVWWNLKAGWTRCFLRVLPALNVLHLLHFLCGEYGRTRTPTVVCQYSSRHPIQCAAVSPCQVSTWPHRVALQGAQWGGRH